MALSPSMRGYLNHENPYHSHPGIPVTCWKMYMSTGSFGWLSPREQCSCHVSTWTCVLPWGVFRFSSCYCRTSLLSQAALVHPKTDQEQQRRLFQSFRLVLEQSSSVGEEGLVHNIICDVLLWWLPEPRGHHLSTYWFAFHTFQGGGLVAVVRGANAPLLQKTILEQLTVERKVLEHGGEHVVVISYWILKHL